MLQNLEMNEFTKLSSSSPAQRLNSRINVVLNEVFIKQKQEVYLGICSFLGLQSNNNNNEHPGIKRQYYSVASFPHPLLYN